MSLGAIQTIADAEEDSNAIAREQWVQMLEQVLEKGGRGGYAAGAVACFTDQVVGRTGRYVSPTDGRSAGVVSADMV